MDQEASGELSAEERIAQLEKQVEEQLQQIAALQKTVIDWHSAMFGAVNLVLKPYQYNLTIEREHLLNLMPSRIDCLVVKKDPSIPIQLDAFRLFSKYNVIEFKSYRDDLDEFVLWRTIGYAATFKSQEKDVKENEITITILRSAFPRELFKKLDRWGWNISEPYHNIYYLRDKIDIPIQIVITKELGEDYLPLQILTGYARETDVRKFVEFREKLQDKMDRYYADAVMWACSEANIDLFKKLKEDEKMNGALREIMKEELDQERQEGIKEGRQEGKMTTLFECVRDGDMKLDRAAKRAGLDTSAFLANMRNAGYAMPEARA